MLQSLMYPEYQLYIIKNDCADVGHFGMARTRTYVIMRHVETTDCLYDPVEMYEEIKKYITSRVQTQPSDYMIATPEEVALEAQHVASVRKVQYVPGTMDLTYLLNEREKATLDAGCAMYWKRFQKTLSKTRTWRSSLGIPILLILPGVRSANAFQLSGSTLARCSSPSTSVGCVVLRSWQPLASQSVASPPP